MQHYVGLDVSVKETSVVTRYRARARPIAPRRRSAPGRRRPLPILIFRVRRGMWQEKLGILCRSRQPFLVENDRMSASSMKLTFLAVGRVRADHGQIGDAVANLKAAHAIAELIDFPDDIISQHERRPAGRGLRVEAAPDQRVLHARGEDADPHLAPAGRRQWSVDHLEPVGTAEAPDLKNPVARLSHGRVLGHVRRPTEA
jgi:hypothetical protein